jgi:large subunit ribosomal protein L22
MEVHAESKFIRITPRKMRLLVDAIKTLSPVVALENLENINKSGSKILIKVITSAMANAVNNNKLEKDKLKFKRFDISEGVRIKRFRPVSRGMAHGYKHRTTHVRVVLEG